MAEKATKGRTAKRPVRKSPRTAVASGADEQQAPLSVAAEVHSVEARASVRHQLADDVARFLDDGGSVKAVPKDFRADPPRRPENNYGRGSI